MDKVPSIVLGRISDWRHEHPSLDGGGEMSSESFFYASEAIRSLVVVCLVR